MHQLANSDLTPRKRVPKNIILNMIESGRYAVRALDGTPITDFRKLFDDYEAAKESQPLPVPPHDPISITQTPPRQLINRHTTRLKVNDSEYTISQLEHFGDAFVSVSARIICHQVFGKNTALYFKYATLLITNENFRTSKQVKSAAHFEIIIGDVFVRTGAEEAIKKGVELLQTTTAYTEAIAETKIFDRQVHHEEIKLQKEAEKRQRASEALDKGPIQNTIADAFPK